MRVYRVAFEAKPGWRVWAVKLACWILQRCHMGAKAWATTKEIAGAAYNHGLLDADEAAERIEVIRRSIPMTGSCHE